MINETCHNICLAQCKSLSTGEKHKYVVAWINTQTCFLRYPETLSCRNNCGEFNFHFSEKSQTLLKVITSQLESHKNILPSGPPPPPTHTINISDDACYYWSVNGGFV